MPVKIYEHLSKVYDLDWGKWARLYLAIIDELLSKHKIEQAKILDLACGTGTLAIELAKKGHFVHGIDICPEMIEIAKSKSDELARVTFEVQDMKEPIVKDSFDLITCTFDSFNYLLDIGDVQKMVDNLASVLNPSGLFIFDSNTENLYITRHKGTHDRQLGSESFLQKLIYDKKNKIATTEFEFSDGTVEVHRQRPYNLNELDGLFADAGFNIINIFSGFEKEPYETESERLICIAQKIES